MVGLLALLASPFAIGWLYQTLGSFRDSRRYPPPGRLCNGLHINAQGNGPAVVLEAGIAGSSVSWKLVADRTAGFARVVTYDRAGLGWSAQSCTTRSLCNIVQELHSLLHSAGILGPFLLVGHSFGGLVVRAFADKYPDETAGIVFVDAVPASDWFPLRPEKRDRLARGVMLSRRGAWLARFGVVRFALARLLSGSRTLPRLLARFSAGNGATVADGLTREVQKLPRQLWPIVQAHWSQPKCFNAMADYLEALPANAEAAAAIEIPKEIPAIALCSDYSVDEPVARRVENSGHWIQLDRPELIVDAIRELLNRQQPAHPEQSGACEEAGRAQPFSRHLQESLETPRA